MFRRCDWMCLVIRIAQRHLIIKYVIGHAHLHQPIWLFRFWLILPRACTPKLLFVVSRMGQAQNAGVRPFPMKIFTRTSHSRVMVIFLLPCPLQSLMVDISSSTIIYYRNVYLQQTFYIFHILVLIQTKSNKSYLY